MCSVPLVNPHAIISACSAQSHIMAHSSTRRLSTHPFFPVDFNLTCLQSKPLLTHTQCSPSDSCHPTLSIPGCSCPVACAASAHESSQGTLITMQPH